MLHFFTKHLPHRVLRLQGRVSALALAALVVSLLHFFQPGLYLAAERLAHDTRISLAPRLHEEQRIVVVDIDEASLAHVAPWPWPRETVAQLIDALATEYQVALIGLDIVFPEARPGDGRLRRSLEKSPAIMAQVFDPAPRSQNRAGILGDNLEVPDQALRHRAGGFIGNTSNLVSSRQALGHITPTVDVDGKVRRLQANWCFEQICSPPLALRMFMHLGGASGLDTQQNAGRNPMLRLTPDLGTNLPLTSDGSLLLPYRLAPDALRHISAADVLNHRADLAVLKGSMVLLGSTALGLADRVATPLSPIASGISIHAELLADILDNALAQAPTWGGWLVFAVIGTWCIAFLWLSPRDLHFGHLALWVLGGACLWGTLNYALWSLKLWAVPFWPGCLFFILAFLLVTALESHRVRSRLGKLAQYFSSYVPESLVHRLLQDEQAFRDHEVERRTLSVLFADIRNFTRMAENSSPEQVAKLIQTLLPAFSSVVSQHYGTVEKFTGDGLMAIWGAPEPDNDHALHAFQAAEAMYQTMQELQPWFISEGFSELGLGIGINTGEAVVGVYGNTSHRAYTAHGDAINVGERVQRLTRETGLPILVGEATARLLPEGCCAPVGQFPVKGRHGYVSVWGRAADMDISAAASH